MDNTYWTWSLLLVASAISFSCGGKIEPQRALEDTGSEVGGNPDAGRFDADSAVDAGTGEAGASDAERDSAETDDGAVDACLPNSCGGCAVLGGKPGSPCGGRCGTAKLQCDGSDHLSCVDPVSTPGPDSACGVCGTQHFECAASGLTTFCPKVDDRSAGVDFAFSAPIERPLSAAISRDREHWFGFRARHSSLSALSLSLRIARVPYACRHDDACGTLDPACKCAPGSGTSGCACSVTTPTDAPIELALWRGTTPLTASVLVATGSLDMAGISTSPSTVSVEMIGTGTGTVALGDPLLLQLWTDDTRYSVRLSGADSSDSAPSDYTYALRARWPFSSALEDQSERPDLSLYTWGCYP